MSDEEDNNQQSEEEGSFEVVDDNEDEEPEVLDDGEDEEEENENEEEEAAVVKNNQNNPAQVPKEEEGSPKEETNSNQNNQVPPVTNTNPQQINDQNEQKEEEEQGEEEEDEEEEERDSEILKQVTDPGVKQLIEIQVSEENKDDVIKLLLSNQIIKKKEEEKGNLDEENEEGPINQKYTSTIKPNSRYMNTISTVKNYIEGQQKLPTYKKTDKFHIYNDDNDPEFTKDFESAKRKILEKLSNREEGNEDKDMEVYRLLFGSSKHRRSMEEMAKKNKDRLKNIGEKIQMASDRKKETINKLTATINEELHNKCPFVPDTKLTNDGKVRTMEEFQKDQQDFINKRKEKIQNMGDERIKKEKEAKHRPQIDKNSEKIFEKVVGKSGNETVHQRLFNQKYATAKTSLLAEKKKKQSAKDKEEEKKKKPKKNKLPWKKKEKEGEEKKEPKPKVIPNQIPKHYLMKDSDIPTNKIIYKNFNDFFDKTLQEFYDNYQQLDENEEKEEEEKLNEINEIEKEEQKEEEKKEGEEGQAEEKKEAEEGQTEEKKEEEAPQKEKKEERKKEELVNGKLTLLQLQEFLHPLGMCSKPKYSFTSSLPNGESKNRKTEIRLIKDLFESLKTEEEPTMISTEHLRQFLLCIIGLQNYILYNQYKAKNIPEKEIEQKVAETNKNFTPDDKVEYCLNEMYNELEKNIDPEKTKNNKYVAYSKDEEGTMIIPLAKAKKIKSEYSLFSVNYMEFREKQNKEIQKKRKEKYNNNNNKEKNNNTFKPEINVKSNQLYENYREKVLKEELDDPDRDEEVKRDKHMEYINKLIMKKKKQITKNQLLKKELEENELKDCTFKPKIEDNPNITIPKAYGANRFNELFKKGSEQIKNRKNKEQNRTQEEVEYEKNKAECSFKPKLETRENSIPEDDNLKFNILTDKSCLLQYERLRNGKMQREIKDAVHDRYGFNANIKEFIKKGQVKDSGQKSSNNENTMNKKTGNDMKSSDNNEKEGSESNNKYTDDANKNSQEEGENQEEKKEEGDGEDEGMDPKEGVPLLIIDVNIRAGVKKKLYVYEGMTAAYLAEKFAKEHNLEPQTQDKLRNLINSHMQRLLTRIDEENNSIAESGK